MTETVSPNNTEQAIQEDQPAAIANLYVFIVALAKKWWLFLIVGAIGGLCGYYYASKKKITYESRLTFSLDDASNSGSFSGAMNLAAQLGFSSGNNGNIFSGDNILELLKSRRMVERVLLSTDTFNNKPTTLVSYFLSLQNTGSKKVKLPEFLPGVDRSTFSYVQDSVLNAVYLQFANVFIVTDRPDKKLMIYQVNVTLTDEKLAKVFTDRLIATTNEFYVEISSKKAKQTLDILEARVSAMKGNLNSSISSRASAVDANLNPAMASAQVPVVKQQMNVQVYGAAYSEMFKNLELARFQYLNTLPLLQIIDYADYPMRKIRPSKLKAAITFAIVACLAVVMIFWLLRLVRMERSKKS